MLTLAKIQTYERFRGDIDGYSRAGGWGDSSGITESDWSLETEGDPPPIFSSLRERLQAAQEAETGPVDHIFDVPVELAKAVTGYHPDETVPGARFVRLSEMSWLRRILS